VANTFISLRLRAVTDDLKIRLAGAPLIFFDGTVVRDDELIAAGLGTRRTREWTYFDVGRSRRDRKPCRLDIGKKVFLHINNSNRRCCAARMSASREHAGCKSPPMNEITL